MRAADSVLQNPRNGYERFIPEHAAEDAKSSRDRGLLERHNRELRERVRLLEAEMRSLEEFTAMASHELLKPMILAEVTASTILERASSRLDLVSQEDLERMTRSSARVRMLVEGLLLDSGRGSGALKLEQVDMASVVKSCLDLLKPEIDARGARVVVEPMPVVNGNQALLNGAVGNLLANALKYGSRANTEIRIAVERRAGSWVFEFDSHGRAIAARDRTAIFDPWRRGHNERRAKGAGLGLTIVRRIVERHGGEVGVMPLNGRHGNRFYFTLPA